MPLKMRSTSNFSYLRSSVALIKKCMYGIMSQGSVGGHFSKVLHNGGARQVLTLIYSLFSNFPSKQGKFRQNASYL